jgi:hypothetical protein
VRSARRGLDLLALGFDASTSQSVGEGSRCPGPVA